MGGHGYSVVHAAADRLETDFICLPRPIVRQDQPDGGPILYRVRHGAKLWSKHERPNLEAEGDRRQSGVFDLGIGEPLYLGSDERSVSGIRDYQEIRNNAVVLPIKRKIDLAAQLAAVCKLLSNPGNQELFCSLQFPRIEVVPPIY